MTAVPGDPDAIAVIRPPRAARFYASVFMVIWCGSVLTVAITIAVRGSPAAIVPVIMLAAGVALGMRIIRASVIMADDALTVRNYFRTRPREA